MSRVFCHVKGSISVRLRVITFLFFFYYNMNILPDTLLKQSPVQDNLLYEATSVCKWNLSVNKVVNLTMSPSYKLWRETIAFPMWISGVNLRWETNALFNIRSDPSINQDAKFLDVLHALLSSKLTLKRWKLPFMRLGEVLRSALQMLAITLLLSRKTRETFLKSWMECRRLPWLIFDYYCFFCFYCITCT